MILYQTEIDINLPYHILKECIKIIQKNKKDENVSIKIVPIVIYINENKYNYNKDLYKHFEITSYDNNIIKLKYNFINVHQIKYKTIIRKTILEELLYIESLKN